MVNASAATAAYGLPIAAALALWWTSTGAVLYLDARDSRTYGRTFAGASVIALGALFLAAAVRDDATIRGAVLAFFAGLACWAWQLVGFYTGFITGPRKTPCPADCVGWRRFVEAVQTSLHHEIAAALGALALAALSARAPNPVALWTYLILWGMHASAKLNLFFGVPNHGEDLLPEHLAYLKSYMARRPMNLFFPVSVTLSTLAAAWLAERAWGAADAFDGRRQRHACDADGSCRAGALVSCRADRRQRALAVRAATPCNGARRGQRGLEPCAARRLRPARPSRGAGVDRVGRFRRRRQHARRCSHARSMGEV